MCLEVYPVTRYYTHTHLEHFSGGKKCTYDKDTLMTRMSLWQGIWIRAVTKLRHSNLNCLWHLHCVLCACLLFYAKWLLFFDSLLLYTSMITTCYTRRYIKWNINNLYVLSQLMMYLTHPYHPVCYPHIIVFFQYEDVYIYLEGIVFYKCILYLSLYLYLVTPS